MYHFISGFALSGLCVFLHYAGIYGIKRKFSVLYIIIAVRLFLFFQTFGICYIVNSFYAVVLCKNEHMKQSVNLCFAVNVGKQFDVSAFDAVSNISYGSLCSLQFFALIRCACRFSCAFCGICKSVLKTLINAFLHIIRNCAEFFGA